ncbi:MAG: 3-hydroxyacyl-CoA dehydrogenase NAD-binding domain-containing protein [Advenella sp.]|jgi:3-hydroxyacyl-CoA dehydrogenase|uniref:3-hydroxyacyl-CoA dehydrogenase NAD-binding domain-containing protein n=1 Tax=unclassified Advenella TaxID=2685285 RepID=UPI00145DCF63|nr:MULTISPECIES: 3-hydroxyacyl-CoA dehydrogenase NAD-binding domain-containing protein [unclassified Advenella]MDD3759183.1 3-hydroxyacyl-CoA dehydrogenase NAD-binding domain-containing protein [Advenella sp.]NLN69077.1 3-hydroxyacyl-CoA dehydrogenase [Alcaligenaceae bacterium]
MSHATYEIKDRVALITFQNPPVNGMSYELRKSLVVFVDQAEADSGVDAIVITGSARAFSGGADVTEFGTPKVLQQPILRVVIEVLENVTKPVVAAIDGVCLGGGLELALGAHYRVAAAHAQIGLPEVKLGLLPGAGGTQRLPRVVGLEKALHMITTGQIIKAKALADTALLDKVVETDVVDAAIAFAKEVVAQNLPLKRVRDIEISPEGAREILDAAREKLENGKKGQIAPLKCLDAVQASVFMSFDEGLKYERELFLQLMSSPESAAMRHIFSAERAATKIPDVPADTLLRKVEKVGVIGAGTMGGGISMNFLNVGIPVVLLEQKQEALDRGVATIRRNYENTMKKGRITAEQVEERMALLSTTLSYDDFADVDLAIEAVFENMDVKKAVFSELDRVMKKGAILASNTSTLDLNVIAGFTSRPEDVIGLHFFSPANVMKLLEIVRGEKTAKDVLATSIALGKKIGKKPVVSGVCDGFIGNRMLYAYRDAADNAMLAGASPSQIDKALENFGFAMGPYRVADLAGLDIGWAVRKRRAEANPEAYVPVVADRICEAGRFGQKTGAGWYKYEAGNRTPIVDPVVENIVREFREARGITPREVSDQEIVNRCVYALVNEGAKILEEGIALRASDIDVVYLNGYGFPAHRGGPMHYAQQVGLFNVVRAIKRFAAASEAEARFWQVSPLLEKHAESNEPLK